MEFEELHDLGLSQAEISVYIALLRLGTSRSGPAIEKAQLHPSSAFLALKSLQEKGLVSAVKVGAVSEYTAAPPQAITAYAQSKVTRAEQIVNQLQAISQTEISESVEMYKGIHGLQTLFFSLFEETDEKEFLYFDAEGHGQEERARLVYVPFHTRAKEAGVHIRGIHRSSSPNREAYEKDADIRYTQAAIPPDTSIFGNTVIMVSWDEHPQAVVITSAQMANQYRQLWNETWKSLK